MANQDRRVLSRLGARELSQEETDRVNGSGTLRTLTICTVPNLKLSALDGDPGECGSV